MANYLPATYQQNWGYSGVGQQMYPQYQPYGQGNQMSMTGTQSMAQSTHGLIWVDGEVGAKAFQMPAGMPANQPVALWDTNDTVIYLKSINPMGMPNPLQKARYTLEGGQQAQMSGTTETPHDMSEYVRKDDMERVKQELLEAINGVGVSGSQASATARKTAKGE